MKKIIIITSEFPPLPGGIGNHALNLALSLHNNGKEITVFTDQRSENIQEDIVFDHSLPIQVNRIRRNKFSVITYLNRIIKTVCFLLKNKNITVISSGKFSLWLGAFLKLWFSKNNTFIGVLHGSEINAGGALSNYLTHWSLKQFDDLVAVSHFTKSIVLKNNNNLKITVINNGFSFLDSATDTVKDVIKGNPSIVTIGNVTYRKGQQNVIKALPLLKEVYPSIHYHIIGIPTEKAAFGQLAQSLNVMDTITFHGALSARNLREIVSQSTVFFMLSDHLKNGDVEGFGIAVLEANSLGLPAIGSKDSGIVDAIKGNYSGELVDPHQPEEIVVALKRIQNNYDNYSVQAKEWSKQFSWEIVVKKYLELID